jgi:hypothetical protein
MRAYFRVAKELDRIGRIRSAVNQLPVFKYGIPPHSIVGVKGSEEKMRGIAGLRVFDFSLAFIGEN